MKEIQLPERLKLKLEALDQEGKNRINQLQQQINHQKALLITGFVSTLPGEEENYQYDVVKGVIVAKEEDTPEAARATG